MNTKQGTPTKESVRKWLAQQVQEHKPPPSPADIRRQLGWDLLPTNHKYLYTD